MKACGAAQQSHLIGRKRRRCVKRSITIRMKTVDPDQSGVIRSEPPHAAPSSRHVLRVFNGEEHLFLFLNCEIEALISLMDTKGSESWFGLCFH